MEHKIESIEEIPYLFSWWGCEYSSGSTGKGTKKHDILDRELLKKDS